MTKTYISFYLHVHFSFRKYKLFYPIPKDILKHTLSSYKIKGSRIVDKPHDQRELIIWWFLICHIQNIWCSILPKVGSYLPYPKYLVLHVTESWKLSVISKISGAPCYRKFEVICHIQNIWCSMLPNVGRYLSYPKYLVLHVTECWKLSVISKISGAPYYRKLTKVSWDFLTTLPTVNERTFL
jgi:hypothetical protein